MKGFRQKRRIYPAYDSLCALHNRGLGAQDKLTRQVARQFLREGVGRTNDVAGEGTMTALLAQAIVRNGLNGELVRRRAGQKALAS